MKEVGKKICLLYETSNYLSFEVARRSPSIPNKGNGDKKTGMKLCEQTFAPSSYLVGFWKQGLGSEQQDFIEEQGEINKSYGKTVVVASRNR